MKAGRDPDAGRVRPGHGSGRRKGRCIPLRMQRPSGFLWCCMVDPRSPRLVVAVARELHVTRVTSWRGGCTHEGPVPRFRSRHGALGGRHRCRGSGGVERGGAGGCAAGGGGTEWGEPGDGVFTGLHDGAGAAVTRPDEPVAVGPGRPRDRPPFLGDRTAVPCCPVTCAGARSHDVPERYATRPSEATRGFLRARPWLARTTGPTKPARGRSRAVRVRAGPNAGAGTHSDASPVRLGYVPGAVHVRPGAVQMRPRHSSSIVIASAVPGLPRASL